MEGIVLVVLEIIVFGQLATVFGQLCGGEVTVTVLDQS